MAKSEATPFIIRPEEDANTLARDANLGLTWRKTNARLQSRQGNLHGLARAVLQSALPAIIQMRECLHCSAHIGWPNPCQNTQTKLVSSAQSHGWRRGSFVSRAGRFCCSQRTFELCLGFRSDINANLMHQRLFSHERRKTPFHRGSGFQFPAQFVARLAYSSVAAPGSTRTCQTGEGQKKKKPDVIDYFLVSTLIRLKKIVTW